MEVNNNLYVARKVCNAQDLADWAESQGFEDITPPNEMHVTVAYSRTPVAYESDDEVLSVSSDNFTHMSILGNAIALFFNSEILQARWQSLIDSGASWDFEYYTPHISISYNNGQLIELDKIVLPTFDIELCGEYAEPLDEDWNLSSSMMLNDDII